MDRHYGSGSRRSWDSGWTDGGSGSGWRGGGSRYGRDDGHMKTEFRREFFRGPRRSFRGRTLTQSHRGMTRGYHGSRSFASRPYSRTSSRGFRRSSGGSRMFGYRGGRGRGDARKPKTAEQNVQEDNSQVKAEPDGKSKKKRIRKRKKPSPEELQDKQRGRNKREIIRNYRSLMFSCPVCKFRTFYKEDLSNHCQSQFHRGRFHFLLHTLFHAKTGFLKKLLMHRYKKIEQRISQIEDHDAFICQVYKEQELTVPLMEESLSKVEAAHCAACGVFIPMDEGLIQAHINTTPHRRMRKGWHGRSRKACLSVVQGILDLKPVQKQYKRYNKGKDPFTKGQDEQDSEDSAVMDVSEAEPTEDEPEEGFEVGDNEEGFEIEDEEEGFEVGDEEEGFEVGDEEEGFEVGDKEAGSEVGKKAPFEVGNEEGFEVVDEEGFEGGDEEGSEGGDQEGSEAADQEGFEAKDEEAASEVENKTCFEVGGEKEEEGFEVGDEEEGFEVGDEEEGFEVGDEEEGFQVGDEEEGFQVGDEENS